MQADIDPFNSRFDALTGSARSERYARLAEAALRSYGLRDVVPAFIRHNGGVTYRLNGEVSQPLYLLKIAQPIGETGGVPRERLVQVMEWLAALATETGIVVQEPIPNWWGELVTTVHFDDLDAPFYATVQRWIGGQHERDRFTSAQAYHIGVMIGQLHRHSAEWTARQLRQGVEQDEGWLADRLTLLHRAVEREILTAEEWTIVGAASERAAEIMGRLGSRPDQWGAVHGDLHHENLLFHGDTVRPIDFGDFRLAHFPYDLGVILYHVMYLNDVEVRRAVLRGYESIRSVPDDVPLWSEAFLCIAALSNLSFQVTIPDQLISDRTVENMKEFVTSYCANLAAGTAFVFD